MKNLPLVSLSLLGVYVMTPVLVRGQTVARPAQTVSAANENSAAQKQILNGVREIAGPGAPGGMSVFAPTAFGLVGGKSGKTARLPVVAAALAGKGRVVGFGHDGFLSSEHLKFADTGRLFDNAMMWASGGQKPAQIGVIANGDAVLGAMRERGYNAVNVQSSDLKGVKTLVVNGHALEDRDLVPLQEFLARGGGLIMATTGWGWRYGDDKARFNEDFVGNQLMAPHGLVWTTGMPGKTSREGFGVEPMSSLSNAADALQMLSEGNTLTPAQSEQISATMNDLLNGLPSSDVRIMPQLKTLAQGTKGDIVPFERRPLGGDDPTARLTLSLQNRLNNRAPVEAIKAHPAGAIFPGDVPPNARPVAKSLTIDTQIPNWHSTGLYAAPGAPITLKLPDGVAANGLSVRIGAHTDTLWHLDSWKRHPEISRVWPLQNGETKVANPFGGLVYLVVPQNAPARTVEVSVSGAHESPLFVMGQTDVGEWKNRIRWAPGPWAEIVTPKLVLTVPSRAVRDLEDPTAIAKYYEIGMKASDELFAKKPRAYAERIVADVQISAGYMHSGYPIMTFLDVEEKTIDINSMNESMWGHWHEVGHNFQRGEWTFEGTGEVTNNLLPLYVWTQLLRKPFAQAHPALLPENWAKDWAKHEAGGRKFENWQREPFLALRMYLQLQQAFGWEPFKTVFAQYEALSEAEKPKTELEKHDQWMVRMARATGRNLGPFFEKWGVPTSQTARDSIANLPAWMPEFPTAPNG